MKILKEPKGVVFTVTGQGLTETEKSQLSATIRKEKMENKKQNIVHSEITIF